MTSTENIKKIPFVKIHKKNNAKRNNEKNKKQMAMLSNLEDFVFFCVSTSV